MHLNPFACRRFYGFIMWRLKRLSVVHKMHLAFVLYMCLCLNSSVIAQSSSNTNCDDTSDCYPPSVDLLNVKYRARSVNASSTCGETGDDTYRRLSTELVTTDYTCNSTFPGSAHNMIDFHVLSLLNLSFENPKLSTYWQSQNTVGTSGATPQEEYIIIDFRDRFLIRMIEIVFISPHTEIDESDMRPRAVVVEKRASNDSTDDWQAWRYYAEDCAQSFPGWYTYADSHTVVLRFRILRVYRDKFVMLCQLGEFP